jgi:hypothetical protein
MTERQEAIEYLTGPYGLDQEEAELVTRDLDLWILELEMRFAIEDEDAVEEWEQAAEFFGDYADMALHSHKNFNEAITHVLFYATRRAQEALRRAKDRAREASHDEEG